MNESEDQKTTESVQVHTMFNEIRQAFDLADQALDEETKFFPSEEEPVTKTYIRALSGEPAGRSEEIKCVSTFPCTMTSYNENPQRATFTRRSLVDGQDTVQTIIFHSTSRVFKGTALTVSGNEEKIVEGNKEYFEYTRLGEVTDLKNRMLASLNELNSDVKAVNINTHGT